MRNALWFKYHGLKPKQRDFDMILLGEREALVSNLLAQGYAFGKKNSDVAVVLRKAKVKNPGADINNWLVLDIKIRSIAPDILAALAGIANFTVNGLALDITDLKSGDWFNKIRGLPGAQDDILHKRLRLVSRWGINIYACARLVFIGFQPPPAAAVKLMLEDYSKLEPERRAQEIDKTIEYIGDPELVREVCARIGIDCEILDQD